MKAAKLARLIGLALVTAVISNANLITSANQIGKSSTVVDFSQFAGAKTIYTEGPVPVGSGVTFRSTNPDGSLLGSGPYSFNNNGTWGSTLTMAGLDVDNFGGDAYSMTFSFAKPVSAVGGILDYAVFPSSGFSDVVITALGSKGQILASYDVTVKAPISGPGGAFVGISQSQADIAAFSLSNSAVAIRDLTFSSSGTPTSPEPSTLLLLGGGIVVLCVGRRKRGRTGVF
jgi:hypothetical protein